MGKKYYAVKVGKTPGVYEEWAQCREMVEGFPGSQFKSFPTKEEAMEYLGSTNPDVSLDISPDTSLDVSDLPVLTDPREAIAYVDGSYNASTGEYGCGVLWYTNTEEITISKKGENPDLVSMRNVAGEILGAEVAMQISLLRGVETLTIYHDYEGVAAWCLGEWKAEKPGTAAYRDYYQSIQDQIKIVFKKVTGHSGDPGNDRADVLAKKSVGQ